MRTQLKTNNYLLTTKEILIMNIKTYNKSYIKVTKELNDLKSKLLEETKEESPIKGIKIGEIFSVEGKGYFIVNGTTALDDVNEHGHKVCLFTII